MTSDVGLPKDDDGFAPLQQVKSTLCQKSKERALAHPQPRHQRKGCVIFPKLRVIFPGFSKAAS